MELLSQHHHILLQVSFWLLFVTGLCADRVEWKRAGEQIEIACSTDQLNQEGMYVYHTYHQSHEVLYLEQQMNCHVRSPYEKKLIQVKGLFTKLTVRIGNLTVNDTGVFWCQYVRNDPPAWHFTSSKDSPTLLVVNGLEKVCPTGAPHTGIITSPEEPISMTTLLMVCAVTAFSLVLLVLIILLVWVKRCCVENGKYRPDPQSGVGLPAHRSDSVYEQMRPQRVTSMSQSSAQVLINPAYADCTRPTAYP